MKLDNISILISIVKEAGDIILKYYKSNIDIEYKRDQTPVTIADREANNLIVDQLKTHFPSIPIISEEQDKNILNDNEKLFWLVDPLDGTESFVNNDPDFTVNIALIKNKSAFIGIIYHPTSNEIFYNLDGSHSYKINSNGIIAQINRSSLSKDQKVIIIGSHSSPSEETLQSFLSKQGPNTTLITRSSSIKFCLLAEGKADIYPRFGETMEWDTAAGQAILKGSGGIVLDLYDNELQYKKDFFINQGFIAYSDK